MSPTHARNVVGDPIPPLKGARNRGDEYRNLRHSGKITVCALSSSGTR
jgi:hypothetical protein